MRNFIVFPLLVYILSATLCGCQSKGQGSHASSAAVDTIPQLIYQIQKCSRLYTTEYQIHKIVTHDDVIKLKGSLFNQSYSIDLPFGDRKVAIPMDATLKGYIDFSNFQPSSIERDGEQIVITLPRPKVVMTSSKIDQQGIREYVGPVRAHYSDRELTELERQGREAILQSIPELGIVEQARISAARLLIPIIQQMGFKEENITIVFPDDFDSNNLRTLIDNNTTEQQ
jgi:hypothetical protein